MAYNSHHFAMRKITLFSYLGAALTGFLFAARLPFVTATYENSAGRISILSPAEFQELKDPITILDARTAPAFREGRIPGSQHIDWKDWTQERADIFGHWFGRPAKAGLSRNPDDALQMELRKLGISNSKQIVVVGEPGGWGEEGRIAWNLLYWGVEHVILLDGGFRAWEALPGTTPEMGLVTKPSPGDFTFRLRPQRRAELEEVKKAQIEGMRLLIDNRSTEEFNGKSIVGQKNGGHIPGAVSLPVEKLYKANGSYIDRSSLAALLKTTKENAPIAYCAGGVRSGLFAMLWEANFGEVIANYDGSIWEWSSNTDLPMELTRSAGLQ